jgi:hypothetical protein
MYHLYSHALPELVGISLHKGCSQFMVTVGPWEHLLTICQSCVYLQGFQVFLLDTGLLDFSLSKKSISKLAVIMAVPIGMRARGMTMTANLSDRFASS